MTTDTGAADDHQHDNSAPTRWHLTLMALAGHLAVAEPLKPGPSQRYRIPGSVPNDDAPPARGQRRGMGTDDGAGETGAERMRRPCMTE